jgi:hypothetical protein
VGGTFAVAIYQHGYVEDVINPTNPNT